MTALATAGLLAAVVTGIGGGAADAGDGFSTQCEHLAETSEWEAAAYDAAGHYIGLALFDEDAFGGRPGDRCLMPHGASRRK